MRKTLVSIGAVLAAVAMTSSSVLAEQYVFEGMLEEGDEVMDGIGQLEAYRDAYDFNIEAGGELRFNIEMRDMQPHLGIIDESGKLVGKTISVLEYFGEWDWKAPASGTYWIIVTTSYQAEQPYRLTITDLPPGTVQDYQRQ